MDPNVILPIIHLNGDRKETLVRHIEAAFDALSAAYDALKDCAPNGRNYYPAPGRMEDALAQHIARQEAVVGVMDSLCAELAGIAGL
jgi:hypothetical protein